MTCSACLGASHTSATPHARHKTVKTNRFIEQFPDSSGPSSTSGHPAKLGRVSSPAPLRHRHARGHFQSKQGGFWWAHLALAPIKRIPPTSSAGLPNSNTGIYKIWGWAETPVIVFSIFVGLILGFGWMGFFWMGAIRLVYSLHMQCLVNSLTHLNKVEEGDSSMNVWWLGPFQLTAWGENWHKNHHTPRRLRAPRPSLVSDRHRLVFHLDARSRRPRSFRQAPPTS